MNWKLIFQLSLFGLFMGVATVYLIPSNIEFILWPIILIFCAYVIGRACSSGRFLHGVLLGLVNSIWINAAHILLVKQYIPSHPEEHAMLKHMPMPAHPRLMMAMLGTGIGLASGIVIGLVALIFGKLVKGSSDTPKAMSQSA